MKYSFKDDYSEGCHPAILDKLTSTNFLQTIGGNYGQDDFCKKAKSLIQQHLANPSSQIHFVSGGTQANLLVISSFLKPHEAVISAKSGHIAVHETGAIEATGHKVVLTSSTEGKLTPNDIHKVLDSHIDEHMVLPKMVYISNATELGTIYTKDELIGLSSFCQQNNLLLFMDGARLGTALRSSKNDLSLADIATLTDVFYIGGTKNGALLGEAIVINNPDFQTNFRYAIKQKGALLAKGRLLGIQFWALFEDDLYFELGEHANRQAQKLYDGLKERGYDFLTDLASNQIFPILPLSLINALQEQYSFHLWEKQGNDMAAIRLVTSWATADDSVQTFLDDVDRLREEA